MRILTYTLFALLLAVSMTACDSFVSDVEDPIDTVVDEELNDPEQVPFLITGVQRQFANTVDDAALLSGGLADELFFDNDLAEATFPTFRDIDNADIGVANNSVDGYFNNLGELRFFSDNLVHRVTNEIEFEDDQQDLRNEALYTGQFYGAVARYFYAAHIGLEPTNGGGVINAGPFIPSDDMYDLALADLDSAATSNTFGEPSEQELRAKYISTLRARVHLFKGEYGAAAQAAIDGLGEGDEPLRGLYATEEDNDFYFGSGPGRSQFAASERFSAYDGAEVYADPDAAAEADRSNIRIPLYRALDTEDNRSFYVQAKYLAREAPINFLTWEENALMLAELEALHGQDISGNPFGTTDPLELINLVRTQYEGVEALSDGTTVDEDLIALEREKEFFVTGLRLVDQRRFDLPFITQDVDLETGEETTSSVPGPWRFLPITQSERNQNPNF